MKKIMLVMAGIAFWQATTSTFAQQTLSKRTDFPLRGISFFSPRSQSAHYERTVIGVHPFLYPNNNKQFHAIVHTTPVYSQSVRPKRIAQALFGKDELTIAGSQVASSTNHDFLADYFGLSPSFLSTVQIDPFIRSLLLETDVTFQLDTIKRGLYVELHAPIGFTRWKLQLHNENIFNNGSDVPFTAGYQAATSTPLAAPVQSFTQAIRGNVSFGAINRGIQKGIIDESHTQKGCADLSVCLGWNFILEEDWHVGMYSMVTAPTGSRPDSTYLFEPILGNGKHWQLGIGFTGHSLIWQALEQELNVYAHLSFSHIFGAHHHRSFDFCANGFASRYLLLKEFDSQGAFTGNVTPAINITTLPCRVSNDLQVDISLMFGYRYNDFVCDMGYNGWIRSKEKISLKGSIAYNRYGIKGIQNVLNVTSNQLDNTTQSTATITGNNVSEQNMVADATVRFVNTHDLNLKSAASPLLITHKFFSYLGHSWPLVSNTHTIAPFFGAGFAIEFEGINERDTFQADKNTLSQWTLFIRGGIAL